MPVKKRERKEKRFMTAQEKRLRQMMLDHEVSQVEIAEVENVSESAIVHRLKSLTPSSVERFEDLIISLSKNRRPQKVAS